MLMFSQHSKQSIDSTGDDLSVDEVLAIALAYLLRTLNRHFSVPSSNFINVNIKKSQLYNLQSVFLQRLYFQ